MKQRRWPISTKFIALMMTPIVTLIGLLAFAASLTAPSVNNLLSAKTLFENVTEPYAALAAALQTERASSLAFLGGSEDDGSRLFTDRNETDAFIASIHEQLALEKTRSAITTATQSLVEDTLRQLDRLVTLRLAIDQRQLDRENTFDTYTSVIELVFLVLHSLASNVNSDITYDLETILTLSQAHEKLSATNAYLLGITTADTLTHSELVTLAGLIETRRFLVSSSTSRLSAENGAKYARILESDPYATIEAFEDVLLSTTKTGTAPPIDMTRWTEAHDTVSTAWLALELSLGEDMVATSNSQGIKRLIQFGLLGLLGLAGIVASSALSLRIWRSLVHRLSLLRQAAESLAAERLPSVLHRMRRDEEIDVLAEIASPDFGDDEIGRVGDAFNTVERVAIESAIKEARLRAGVNKVFLNIARRSQTLLHRQLSLLDDMERKTVDPTQLQELFQLDHLATRMRRNSEDLVILAGATPARGWRSPVSLIDIVRGAISEVEDYARVILQSMPEIALAGPCVADMTHLVAELLENASAFSPPDTPVFVGGKLTPGGFVLDIEDRGLGMDPEGLHQANERLSRPPEFDPTNSARLGLFVVATLAARHNIKVSLKRSPYGGVTALVLIPMSLVVEGPSAEPTISEFSPPNERTPHLGWGVPVPAEASAGPSLASVVSPTVAIPGVGSLLDIQVTMTGAETVATSSGPPETVERHPRPRPVDSLPRPSIPSIPSTPSLPSAPSIPSIPSTPSAPSIPSDSPVPSSPRQTPPPLEHTEDGLPRRRRQEHLAPQLRTSPAPTAARTVTWEAAAPNPTPEVRSPESIRSLMSSLQAGTERGRQQSTGLAQQEQPTATLGDGRYIGAYPPAEGE